MINFSSWPHYEEDEIKAVTHILSSGKVNYWTGTEGKLFEKEFAQYIGVKYSVAVMNGTVALELILSCLDIKAGDEVIVPCRTFIGTASAVIKMGATPIMADIDVNNQNINVANINAVLTPRTKAIIVVHLAGWPCDMESIISYAKQKNLYVIEDCAQAIGASIKGQKVGSWGDVAAFSFCQDKILTTGGEGGMVVTNNFELWQKMWAYKDHGKDYDAVFNKEHPIGFRWLHESFGTNLRMTEMQAAIGRIQLRKIESWIELRRRNAAILTQRLKTISALLINQPHDEIKHAYYVYYAFVISERLKDEWTRDKLLELLNAENIPCSVGICPEIYLELAFKKLDLSSPKRLPNAQYLGERSLMFYVHPRLTVDDMHHMANVIEKIFSKASK